MAVLSAGRLNPEAKGDSAIVLGAAVWDDEPSPVLAARIDHSITLHKRGQVRKIIMTGGRAEGDSLSEGEAARRYAIQKGVPSRDILVEDKSTDTGENLKYAAQIMKEERLGSAVIVSDPNHMFRASLIARRLDLDFASAPTPTTRYQGFTANAKQISQEIVSVTKLAIFGD